MQRSLIAIVLLLAGTAIAGAAQKSNANAKEITLQACVMAGVDKDTYYMTRATEVTPSGGARLPEGAHGRRVLFWLHDDNDVRKHIGQLVEVKGTWRDLEKSEIELKAGRQKDGGLIVEFEGPGKDVLAPNSVVGPAVGTAGRAVPEHDDIPTYLVNVDVKEVRAMGACK
jgi:hypothetical protein